MPLCAGCGIDKPRKEFSRNQLNGTKPQKRCFACTHDEKTGVTAETRLDPNDAITYRHIRHEQVPNIILISSASQSRDLQRLSEEAAEASLVAFDAEWDHWSMPTAGICVLQLAFPATGNIYVLQTHGIGDAMPEVVWKLFTKNGSRRIVGFGVLQDAKRLRFHHPCLSDLNRFHDLLDIQGLASTFAYSAEHNTEVYPCLCGPLPPLASTSASTSAQVHNLSLRAASVRMAPPSRLPHGSFLDCIWRRAQRLQSLRGAQWI